MYCPQELNSSLAVNIISPLLGGRPDLCYHQAYYFVDCLALAVSSPGSEIHGERDPIHSQIVHGCISSRGGKCSHLIKKNQI